MYIFDDNSEDSSLESLKCFDSKYITIYGMNDTDVLGYLGTDDRKRLVHELIYAKMYKQAAKKRLDVGDMKAKQEHIDSYLLVSSSVFIACPSIYDLYIIFLCVCARARVCFCGYSSDWVIMVDGDEFITSRAEPNRTIKEILQADYKHCGIVSVPWIIYSWGHQVSTPNNTVRYQLNYRWMLDEEHAVPNTQPYPFKWRNRHVEGIEAKVIVNTTSVRSLGQSLHSSMFSGPVTSGTVCVPRVDGPLSCAAEISANHTRLQSFAAVPQSPNKNRGYYIDLHGSHEGLEQWCPYGNEILSHQSPDHLCIKESDIDKLRLATFHYQVKSKEDWERKKGKSRHFNGAYVLGKVRQ